MTVRLGRQLQLALILALSLFLGACGGSSGSSGSSKPKDPTPNEDTSVSEGVQGPLDLLQEPLSSQVLAQLENALGGTPLEGVIDCVDQAVVIDIVDVLDSITLALTQATQGDPAAAFNDATGNIQASLDELAHDLPNLLAALTGGDCSGGNTGSGGSEPGSNPLAGTPLEPLGAALAPVLSSFTTSNPDQDMNLTALAMLVSSLNDAFQSGLQQALAQDPTGQIESAPILGGVLTTLSIALDDLDGTMQAVGNYDSDGTAEGLHQTLDNLLVNVLTQVVPIRFIEEQTGQEGLFTAQIEDGVTQAFSPLGSGLTVILDPLFEQALSGGLTPLLDPIENTLLPTLLGPITSALGDGGTVTGGTTGTPLDVVLDPLLGPVLSVLTGGASSSGGITGTPLDLLLDPLAGPISSGGVGACPVAGTPLDPVCGVVDSLLGALSADPSADPLAILTGLLDTLLGGLV